MLHWRAAVAALLGVAPSAGSTQSSTGQAALPAPAPPPDLVIDPPVPIRAAEVVLVTLEQRRNQLATKSTVCGAAATAIIFGVAQVLVAGQASLPVYIVIPAVAAVVAATAALVEALNVIKRLGRRGRKTRQANVKHLLHFQTLARLGRQDTRDILLKLDIEGYVSEIAAQAASLSRNIALRYTALGRAYTWLTVAAIFFVIGVCLTITVPNTVGGQPRTPPSPAPSAEPSPHPRSNSPAPSTAPAVSVSPSRGQSDGS